MSSLPTTHFTTRIDKDLKARLERVAEYENRSASYVANQAIKALVEEREQTHELVAVGIQLAEKGVGTSEAAVSDWLRSADDVSFPAPDVTTP